FRSPSEVLIRPGATCYTYGFGTSRCPPLVKRDYSYGGRSSGVERLTVAQEVAGSKPVAHPNSLHVHPKNRRVALLLSVACTAVLASSCRANAPARKPVEPQTSGAVASASQSDDRDRSTRCDEQANLVAASTMRREDRKRPPQWEAHYSEKYDQCYVRIDRMVDNAGAPAVVSEL